MSKLISHKRLRNSVAAIATVVTMTAAAAPAATPRLVVGIFVKELDMQQLEVLREHFGTGGFKRLMSDGVVITGADYGTSLDAVAATTMAVTGSSPRANGIAAAMNYDSEGRRTVFTLSDERYIGNYTNETFSPQAINVSTIADEVRIAGDGITAAYGIAADAQQAIVLAGHAANAALWINGASGNWASTTYYKDIPQALQLRNRTKPLSARLDTMSWQPLTTPAHYPGLPDHLTHYPFRHTFGRALANRYDVFKASALCNSEVTDMACDVMATMGAHDGIDMLSVAYDLTPYPYSRTTDNRFELIDAYLRLDRDIARLLQAADKAGGGRDAAIAFVVGTPPQRRQRKDDDKFNIPYGEFSSRKAVSLLNMYLIAVYGNGDWVKGYYDHYFYLNTRLAKDRNIDISDMRGEAADFLKRMSGIKSAYTSEEILTGTAGEYGAELRRNTTVATAGDVLIEVLPGWETIDDYNTPGDAARVRMVERAAATTAPAFIIAPGITPCVITEAVDARALARTIAGILRIRAPNAAYTRVISLRR